MKKWQNQYRRRTSLRSATHPIGTNCNHRGRNGHVNVRPIIRRSFGADFLDGIVDGVHADGLLDFTAAEVLSSEDFLWFFHWCRERLCCGKERRGINLSGRLFVTNTYHVSFDADGSLSASRSVERLSWLTSCNHPTALNAQS